MEKKEITVSLPGIDRPAIITLSRAGQASPAEGDDVLVSWQLCLPAEDGCTFQLHPALRFADRVEPVCKVRLSHSWGGPTSRRGYVASGGMVSAKKWSEAFKKAEDYVLGELGKLIDALRARQRALEAADEN